MGLDGDINAVFHDTDGSLSGVKNSSIVTLNPFFNTFTCSERKNWNAQVVTKKYVAEN